MNSPKNPLFRNLHKRGFALVVTLVLMVLLAILALGLLSLSSLELRTTGAQQSQALARQNAIFAMNLAIGELQKNLGPDQRTSATAGLTDARFETNNPNWVGAWNTEGGFRGWLVSGNENIPQPTNEATDVTGSSISFDPSIPPTQNSSNSTGWAFGASSAAQLVGENSTGTTGLDRAQHVFAPVIDLKSKTTSEVTGRYAWWVGDEGTKANIGMDVVAPQLASQMVDHLKFRKATPNRGFPTLGVPWTEWISDNDDSPIAQASGKIVSRNQIPLVNRNLASQEKAMFHDFTTISKGVLSDSKHGGLRKDFSIAFELPEPAFRNSEFSRVLTGGELEPNTAYATNHSGRVNGTFAGRSTKTAVNFRDRSWPNNQVFRGPTFDLLRDHYQLYRRVTNPFSANASINSQVFMPNVQNTTGRDNRLRAPYADYHRSENPPHYYIDIGTNFEVTDTYSTDGRQRERIRPMTTELVPEMIRFTYSFALQSHRDVSDPSKFNLRWLYSPYFVLHNPYNVRLNSDGMWFRITRQELQFELQRDNGTGNWVDASEVGSIRSTLYRYFGNDTNIERGGGTVKGELAHEAVDYLLTDNGNPQGRIVLQPGETKLFVAAGATPISIVNLFSPGANRTFPLQAVNQPDDLSFSTGFYMDVLRRDRTAAEVQADDARGKKGFEVARKMQFLSNEKIKVSRIHNDGISNKPEPWKPTFAAAANEYHSIWSKMVPAGLPVGPLTLGVNQSWDQVNSMHFFADRYWTGVTNPVNRTEMSVISLEAPPDGPRRYIGKTDMYLKPANDGPGRDNNFSLTTHNPRAMVQNMTMTGAQGPTSGRGPATWTGSIEAFDIGGSNSPDFNARFWGTATRLNEGGQRLVTLFDVPRAPLSSIAAFQNANVTRLGNTPAYAIGNSYASPYVPSNGLWWNRSNYYIVDHSYVYNEALFDSYYFSGVNPGHTASNWNNTLSGPSVSLNNDPTNLSFLQTSINAWRTGATPLLNSRMKFSIPPSLQASDADDDLDLATSYNATQASLATAADLRPHNTIAAYIENEGAFNINSTSIPAWRAILAGFRGAAVDHFNTSGNLAVSLNNATAPFPRGSVPGAGPTTGSDAKLWNGFRNLSDVEIQSLAANIVAEIKARSRAISRPFTTIGEFVNRRPGNQSDPFALKGALQAAIDASGVNSPSNLTNEPPIPSDTNSRSTRGGQETNAIPFQNPAALVPATISGTPQWLTQADLLELIGPQMSARSDSFVIRSYGESVNPKTGKVEGRAWLEATVQRGTDFVDPTNHPALPLTSPEFTAINDNLGRRFRLISFRWLSPEEI